MKIVKLFNVVLFVTPSFETMVLMGMKTRFPAFTQSQYGILTLRVR